MTERDLVIQSEEPLNAETRLERQRGIMTPAGRHYVRTHFPIPRTSGALVIEGTRRVLVTTDDVRELPRRTVAVTLECAGNGRRFLEPNVPGEQWGLGAVGTAEWTGVPLRALLDRAGIDTGAVEVLFRGADEGAPKDLGRRIAYERSLAMADALREDVLVAYLMNAKAIPKEYGGPLRLVVPGWYGMASVKWLTRISFLDRPFTGFYQADRYVIEGRPLREIAPRAVITSPIDGAEVTGRGARVIVTIRGYAWSGTSPIAHVEVSERSARAARADRPWRKARLGPAVSPYAWREFGLELGIGFEGPRREAVLELVARATDAAGDQQPMEPRWTALGYANNGSRAVRVRVIARS